MRNRWRSEPDPEWQRATALREVERIRKKYKDAGQSPSDAHIANIAAGYVGARDADVLRWMKGGK